MSIGSTSMIGVETCTEVEVDLVFGDARACVGTGCDLKSDTGGDGRAVEATGVCTTDLGTPAVVEGGTVDVVSAGGFWNSKVLGGALEGVMTSKIRCTFIKYRCLVRGGESAPGKATASFDSRV